MCCCLNWKKREENRISYPLNPFSNKHFKNRQLCFISCCRGNKTLPIWRTEYKLTSGDWGKFLCSLFQKKIKEEKEKQEREKRREKAKEKKERKREEERERERRKEKETTRKREKERERRQERERKEELKASVKCRSPKHMLILLYKVTFNPLVPRFYSPRGIKPNREQLTLSRPGSSL